MLNTLYCRITSPAVHTYKAQPSFAQICDLYEKTSKVTQITSPAGHTQPEFPLTITISCNLLNSSIFFCNLSLFFNRFLLFFHLCTTVELTT